LEKFETHEIISQHLYHLSDKIWINCQTMAGHMTRNTPQGQIINDVLFCTKPTTRNKAVNINHRLGHIVKAAAHDNGTRAENKAHAEHTEHPNKSSGKGLHHMKMA
jgi:hypothetical protein